MVKINIKIKKNGQKHIHFKDIKDGPELIDIKEEKGRKKTNIDPKDAPRILKIKEKKPIKIKKRNFKFKLAYLLIPLLLLILGIGSYFGYNLLKKDRIIRILPEKTVFYGKIDINKIQKKYQEDNLGEVINKLSSPQEFNKEIVKVLNSKVFLNYGLDYDIDLKNKIKDEISIVTFVDDHNLHNMHSVLFLGVNDKENIKKTINKSAGIDYINNYSYEDSDIYEIVFKEEKNNYYYSFYSDFLILAKDDKALEEILSVSNKQKTSLSRSQAFKKSVPYLYRLENNYFYVNLNLISFEDIKERDFFGLDLEKSFLYYAFLEKNSPMAFYFKPESNGLNIYAHSSQKKENNAEVNVSNFVPHDASLMYSGYNLKDDIIEYIDIFKEENDTAKKIGGMAGLINNEYNLNLDNLGSFFANESEISIIPRNNKNELLVTLKVEDNSNNKKKMKEIERAVSHYLGVINPSDKEFKLADGSMALELFANDKKFPFKDVKYNDLNIRSITNKEINDHYAYAFYEDRLILSTQEKIIKEAIDNSKDNKNLLNDSDYAKIINNKISNEILYLDLSKVYDKIGNSENGFYQHFQKLVLTSENKTNRTDFIGTFLIK